MQRNVKLTIAYDGSNYHGWQRQADGIATIQQTIEDTLVRVVKHPATIRGSGRTDTGVHAAGQVANFFTDTAIPTERLAPALNSRLPGDIRIRKSRDVGDNFDSMTSTRSKLYRYCVYNHRHLPPQSDKYCYHYYYPCQLEPMQRAAGALIGRHDFASFAAAAGQRQTTIRTLLRCQVFRRYHWLNFDLEATGFLYHMVRNIVGALLEIGRGHWPAERITDILNARDRAAAGPMAPPNGLTLQWVHYNPTVPEHVEYPNPINPLNHSDTTWP